MSADNGIYILPVFVNTSDERATYFLVQERSAVENLTYEPDRTDGYNTEELMTDLFNEQAIRTQYVCKSATRAQALEHAANLSEKHYTEYGIVLLDPVKGVPQQASDFFRS